MPNHPADRDRRPDAPGARRAPGAPAGTERLRLRRLTPADAGALAALHGDPDVMRRIDDGRPVPPEVVARETLPALLREYHDLPPGHGCFAAEERVAEERADGERADGERADGAFVGWFSLRPAVTRGLVGGGTELGYRLRPAAWGRGYATEGARAMVAHAFTELGADRVVATTMTVHTHSRRVLEKAGLVLVRTFFETWPEYVEGAEHGDVEYALTRAEWAARP